MSFNSLAYIVFLPAVIVAYGTVPARFRWAVLLAASYTFYASWSPKHVLLMLAVTIVTYVAALVLGEAKGLTRRIAVVAGILLPLVLLGVFKYSRFVAESLNELLVPLADADITVPDIVLPVGISFFTFQGLSYVIDVARRRHGPERHLGHYALYVSFFPQLVAGPIERVGVLLPQLLRAAQASANDIAIGLRWIAWGLFKKIVVADNIAPYVDLVYANPLRATPMELALATYLFGFQIYCDFSGYTDIASGSARCFGVRLSQNFFQPYFASSPRDFWHRWHITLSTWFRDYVYIPLGGSRRSGWRAAGNIMVTFAASGLWHGANWTFVLWGLVHGLSLVVQRLAEPLTRHLGAMLRPRVPPAAMLCAAVLGTFVLVNSFWVFFRASTAYEAIRIYIALPRGLMEIAVNPFKAIAELEGRALSGWQVAVVLCGILVVVLAEAKVLRRLQVPVASKPSRQWLSAVPEATLLAACVAFQPGLMQQFIYFQF